MNSSDAIYRELVDRLVLWAQSQRDIRAIGTVGSRACADATVDEWSDLDVVFVCRKPRRFVDDHQWLSGIEAPWLTYVIKTPIGERLARGAVFREGRATIDFAVVGTTSLRVALALLRLFMRRPGAAHLVPAPFSGQLDFFARMLGRGTHVLLDKDGVLTRLASARIRWPVPRPPSEQQFADAVATFWGYALWTAKKLRRGDLWRCAVAADRDLKELVPQMVEWHARATHGSDYETWYLGRHLDRWADPRVVSALPSLFARYDAADLWSALAATNDVYAWVARETAERLGHHYPDEAEQRVRGAISDLRAACSSHAAR